MTTNAGDNQSENLLLAATLAILFMVIAAAAVWVTQVRPTAPQIQGEPVAIVRPVKEDVTDNVAAAPPETPVDLEATIAAINKGGCVACHTIPGIPGAVGQVGPNLANIGVDGATRIDGYTAKEYIHESIVNPLAFTAPECPTGPCIAGAMPPIQLTEAEVEAIVNYLSTLGTAGAASQ